MAGQCPQCGCHTFEHNVVEGFSVLECGVCGYIDGKDSVVAEIEDIRLAREQNIDLEIWPLVKIINRLPNIKTFSSCGGHIEADGRHPLPPYVQFDITSETHLTLEKLLTSMNMSNKRTSARWIIQVNMDKALTFTMRPVFSLGITDLSVTQIGQAQKDIAIIAGHLERDLRLKFWHR